MNRPYTKAKYLAAFTSYTARAADNNSALQTSVGPTHAGKIREGVGPAINRWYEPTASLYASIEGK